MTLDLERGTFQFVTRCPPQRPRQKGHHYRLRRVPQELLRNDIEWIARLGPKTHMSQSADTMWATQPQRSPRVASSNSTDTQSNVDRRLVGFQSLKPLTSRAVRNRCRTTRLQRREGPFANDGIVAEQEKD